MLLYVLSDHDKETSDLRKEEGTVKTEDADAWTAHRTESGVVYYYNSVTKESTYEKPAGFKGEVVAQKIYFIK